ncbi:MAG: type 1 periplasmic binding fold superfamily protein [Flavobacteriales bacterium]
MKKTFRPVLILLLVASAATGCKKDKEAPSTPAPEHENEVITTVRLTFEDQGTGPDKVWQFRDIDGDGGAPGVITADTLLPNATYHATLLVLNESVSPVDTTSNEVLELGTLHQFFFQVSGANVAFAYADTDANGKPIGLHTVATTAAASSGTVKVTLRHEPDKNGANVSAGDITHAGGSTDVEVTFPAVIH